MFEYKFFTLILMDHNYELLFRRTLKEKKNIQSNNIKGRNLHASLPRPIEGLVSDEDISIFLKYKEKFQNLHPFQKEIIINIFKEPNGREYTKDFKKYCYCLYNRSPREYELLRVILPFPTYKTLHSTFQNEISE